MRRVTDVVPIVGGILLIGLFGWAFIFGDGGRDARGKINAQVLCKNAVRDAAQFPAMASFSGMLNLADEDARYLVSGSVHLMNEAGDMVPHAFVCDFHKQTGKATLLSLLEKRVE